MVEHKAEAPEDLEALVEASKAGNKAALEALIEAIQDRIYGLALRMLWNPESAKDATQEILLQIITHLGTFRGDSSFRTWMYRVASNHLLKVKRSQREEQAVGPEQLGALIAAGLTYAEHIMQTPFDVDAELLAEEIRIACTMGMLTLLDRKHRLVYVLGEVLKFNSHEGSAILEINAAAFRKRLERAREIMRPFIRTHCGVINEAAACRCLKQAPYMIHAGIVDTEQLQFAEHPTRCKHDPLVQQSMEELDELQRIVANYQSYPEFASPDDLLSSFKEWLDDDRFGLLQ